MCKKQLKDKKSTKHFQRSINPHGQALQAGRLRLLEHHKNTMVFFTLKVTDILCLSTVFCTPKKHFKLHQSEIIANIISIYRIQFACLLNKDFGQKPMKEKMQESEKLQPDHDQFCTTVFCVNLVVFILKMLHLWLKIAQCKICRNLLEIQNSMPYS